MNAELHTLAEACSSAVRRGLDYLLGHYDPAGGETTLARNLVAHYKMPYVLARLGRADVAGGAMDHIANEFLDEQGDLRRQGSKTLNPVYADHLDHYMTTWVIRGAAALARREAAEGMLEYLKTQQDGQTGGIGTRRGAGQADVGTTAAFGLAACDVGDIQAAAAAAGFLGLALDAQPTADALPLRFDGRNPVRQYPTDAAGFFVIHADAEGQAYWFPGIAVAFLTRLAMETGQDAHATRARDFMAFAMTCADDKYATLASGKLGWGAKLLGLHTGEAAFFHPARIVAENLLHVQRDDGRWTLPDDGGGAQEDPAVTLDVTAEMSLWLLEAEDLFRSQGSAG